MWCLLLFRCSDLDTDSPEKLQQAQEDQEDADHLEGPKPDGWFALAQPSDERTIRRPDGTTPALPQNTVRPQAETLYPHTVVFVGFSLSWILVVVIDFVLVSRANCGADTALMGIT